MQGSEGSVTKDNEICIIFKAFGDICYLRLHQHLLHQEEEEEEELD
jgi:hypothetical protein